MLELQVVNIRWWDIGLLILMPVLLTWAEGRLMGRMLVASVIWFWLHLGMNCTVEDTE